MSVEKIILASPRGFCAGVDMSIKALIWLMYSCQNKRVYCYHEIVHNNVVVNWFQNRGVRFVNSLEDIPEKFNDKVALMLSAHGTDPKIEKIARERFSVVINSACPLVTKVHNEVKKSNRNKDQVIYFGNPDHDEGQGVLGVSTDSVYCINSIEDIDALPDLDGKPIRFLSQTTKSQEAYKKILENLNARFPSVSAPKHSDLCFATTNRQNALKKLGEMCDSMIIVGSRQSANTNSLFNIAKKVCKSVQLVNATVDIDMNIEGVVGITAGASAPETLVKEICDFINPSLGVETLVTTDEEEYFRPPADLRLLEKNGVAKRYYALSDDKHIDVASLLQEL